MPCSSSSYFFFFFFRFPPPHQKSQIIVTAADTVMVMTTFFFILPMRCEAVREKGTLAHGASDRRHHILGRHRPCVLFPQAATLRRGDSVELHEVPCGPRRESSSTLLPRGPTGAGHGGGRQEGSGRRASPCKAPHHDGIASECCRGSGYSVCGRVPLSVGEGG